MAVLCALALHAQVEQQKWYFGNRAGLDFSSGSPVPLLDGEMTALEGCASFCDLNGNLLCYSNGDTVWDASHTPMPNGLALAGHQSSTQSSLFVPQPGSSTLIYLFTIDAQAGTGGFSYSEIDMTLNAGLGDINANKNVQLLPQACEKIAAVLHANGADVWVVVHEWNTNAFRAYLVSASGISAPVVSAAGSTIAASNSLNIETVGCMKISADGRHLAVANYGGYEIQLFDFDNNTGTVSAARTVSSTYMSYGIEFSPNSNYLYAVTWVWGSGTIYQYDVTAPNVAQSQTAVGSITFAPNQAAGTLQRAPDNKIYMAIIGSAFLSVIQSPDLPGMACGFTANGISLGGRTSQAGLPNSVSLPGAPEEPSAVHATAAASALRLYPNPAHDVVYVDCSALGGTFTVALHNALGQEIERTTYAQAQVAEIDVHACDAGVYFVTLLSDDAVIRKEIVVR